MQAVFFPFFGRPGIDLDDLPLALVASSYISARTRLSHVHTAAIGRQDLNIFLQFKLKEKIKRSRSLTRSAAGAPPTRGAVRVGGTLIKLTENGR